MNEMNLGEQITAVPFDEWEIVTHCDLCGGADFKSTDDRLRVARCKRCGHTFFERRPTQQAIARHYDQGDNYAMWLGQTENRRRANLRRLDLIAPYLTRGPILDVGCGMGEFLNLVAERWPRVGLYGTELSKTALTLAKEKFGLQHLFCGQLQDAQWPEGSFETITLWQVLEHVPSPSAVVRKANDLLQDGGRLLIAVPNDSDARAFSRWVKHALQRCIGRTPPTRYDPLGAHGEVHLHHFSPRTLRYLLSQNRFRVIQGDLDLCRAPTFSHILFVHICRFADKFLRCNLYETMVVIAQKVGPHGRGSERT